MLLQRIISSIILIPTFLLILFYAPLSIFVLTITIIAAIGIYEFIKMAENKNIKINLYLAYGLMIFEILVSFSNEKNKWQELIPLIFIIYLLRIFNEIRYNNYKSLFFNKLDLIFWCLCVNFYIAWTLRFAIYLYKIDVLLVLMVLLITWANDTGAYFIGKTFGKNKLAPTISPGKTIEGSIAGILAGTITIIAFKYIDKIQFLQKISYIEILLGGIIISISGQVGDLYESNIKRAFNVKDSGNLIPGHGGILDRIDSLLFAFPVAYYLVLFSKL